MADKSLIEWTDTTWQVVTGCSVVSPGCTNCYAMKLAGTRLRHHPSRAGLTTATKAGPVWNGQVRFNAQWLTQPLRWKRPRRIFVAAHGDLFHDGVTDDQLDQIFAVMALSPRHTFQILTKRPERMRAYLSDDPIGRVLAWTDHVIDMSLESPPSPLEVMAAQDLLAEGNTALPNVWLGVSVEDQARADERIPVLLDTPAAVRWISAEPLLGPVDLRGYVRGWPGQGSRDWSTFTWPEWVPPNVRATVEDFWSVKWGRGVGEWLRGSIQNNGQPPLGTSGRYALCTDDPGFVDGRFVPAWNNIGRVVANGEVFVVSAGQYQGRSRYIDWVVAGGESGPGARPMHPDWARQLRDQCAAAGVPFLFKQWGDWGPVTVEGDPGWDTIDEGIDPATATVLDPRETCLLHVDGRREDDGGMAWPDAEPRQMLRMGKKGTGRHLDGMLHDAYPEARS